MAKPRYKCCSYDSLCLKRSLQKYQCNNFKGVYILCYVDIILIYCCITEMLCGQLRLCQTDIHHWIMLLYPLQGLESISDYPISFHYIQPDQMYMLEFYTYHLRPFGVHYDNFYNGRKYWTLWHNVMTVEDIFVTYFHHGRFIWIEIPQRLRNVHAS